jgi:hypothetical protein
MMSEKCDVRNKQRPADVIKKEMISEINDVKRKMVSETGRTSGPGAE